MNTAQIKEEVYWYEGKTPETKRLGKNLHTEVVIVGGGMAGLSAAQAFHEKGKKVVILEKYFCGAGASGRSSGFITPDSELELYDIIENHGEEGAKQLWGFVTNGIEKICKNIENHKFECDYQVQDSLYIAEAADESKSVRAEYEAHTKLGYESRFYEREELNELVGSQRFFSGVRYGGTFGMNSYLYCQELKKHLQKEGVEIYEDSPIVSVEGNIVKTSEFEVKADTIVLCMDYWAEDVGKLKDQVYPVETFLAISEQLTNEQVKMIFPNEKLMVWDTDLVYHYFRVTGDNRLLIGGSNWMYSYSKLRPVDLNKIAKSHYDYVVKRFPGLEFEIEAVWPGSVGSSKDILPIAGQDKENKSLYYIAGAAGLPWAAELGWYIADMVEEGRDDYEKYFSPHRKYVVNKNWQSVLRNPLTFLVSHFWAKYRR